MWVLDMVNIEVELNRGDPLHRYCAVSFALYNIRKELMSSYCTAQQKGTYEARKKDADCADADRADADRAQKAPEAPESQSREAPESQSREAQEAREAREARESHGHGAGQRVKHGSNCVIETEQRSKCEQQTESPSAQDNKKVRSTIRKLARALKVKTHPDRAWCTYDPSWFQDIHEAAASQTLWILLGFTHVVKTGVEIPQACLYYAFDEITCVCSCLNSLLSHSVFKEHGSSDWWRNVSCSPSRSAS